MQTKKISFRSYYIVLSVLLILSLIIATRVGAVNLDYGKIFLFIQRALGFRLYMTTAEKYRQQFAAKADIFTQLLPYAIVFGCVAMWSKAFEGIDTSSSSGWYLSPHPFQASMLANSLQSMNTSISSVISYTPPSSGSGSGLGGGGGAGGGGGGGGGGSW